MYVYGGKIKYMKKNKLIVEYEYDFHLLGVISPGKEYKLAWLINEVLGIRLIKAKDLVLEFLNNKNIIISNYLFKTEHSIFRLIRNKSYGRNNEGQSYLLPELKDFDYLIIFKGFEDTYNTSEIIDKLKLIKEIQYLQKIEINALKSKENLIF